VFIVLAVAVGIISGFGAFTLTDAHTVDEHPAPTPSVDAVIDESVR